MKPEIEQCERETDHRRVPGTNFCRCTHVMYDELVETEEASFLQVTVNGRELEVNGSPLTYEAGVRDGLWREGETVTYQGPRRGDVQRAGILGPGKAVNVEPGMRFTACFTGGA